MWISGCNTTTMSAFIQVDIILEKHLYKPGENRYILQKRETSSAGEQPVRNNPIDRNGRGSDAPSFPLAIPVINDNNGKIYTFMTNLSPLQTYINRLCQIRRLNEFCGELSARSCSERSALGGHALGAQNVRQPGEPLEIGRAHV